MGYCWYKRITMIKTKIAIKRDKRNDSIKIMYKDLMAINGSMKSAVVEQIAKDLKTSVATVNRVVKPKPIQ